MKQRWLGNAEKAGTREYAVKVQAQLGGELRCDDGWWWVDLGEGNREEADVEGVHMGAAGSDGGRADVGGMAVDGDRLKVNHMLRIEMEGRALDAYVRGVQDGAQRMATELADAKVKMVRVDQLQEDAANLAASVLQADLHSGVSREDWASIRKLAMRVAR